MYAICIYYLKYLNGVDFFMVVSFCKQVKDIVTRLRRNEYRGDYVTRQQFLSVLANIKYILLRATYHTDQIECSLEQMVLHVGDLETPQSYSLVEQCSCPSGYSGLSCESCSYGYVRMAVNVTANEPQDFCLKCDCSGHSQVWKYLLFLVFLSL